MQAADAMRAAGLTLSLARVNRTSTRRRTIKTRLSQRSEPEDSTRLPASANCKSDHRNVSSRFRGDNERNEAAATSGGKQAILTRSFRW